MRIILTGGGTAGHITPNIALIPELKRRGFEIHYLGTQAGMERRLIEPLGVAYHAIRAGKFRRYLNLKNLTDLFQIMRGFTESVAIINRLRPEAVFSKGGFVSSPVVWAAWLLRVPVIIHESDLTPGLANKLSIPFANKVCYTFPETAGYLPPAKAILTGLPVRENLLRGDPAAGRRICGFSDPKPALMVIGGSQGSVLLNNAVREVLTQLRERFNICHICGKNGVDPALNNLDGYQQFGYVNEELPDLLAMADLVVSRAGATTLFELLALKKPHLLIPLSKQASRGDQILNARSFEKQGFSKVLPEEELTGATLIHNINQVYESRAKYSEAMRQSRFANGIEAVIAVIEAVIKSKSKS